MCAGVGIADTGGLAGSASDFAVPANTGEMAAYFAIQKRPPGAASSSLSQQQQNKRRTSAASSRGSCRRPHAAAAAEQAARRVRGARVVVPLPAAAERPAPPRRVGGARVVVPLPAAAAAGRPAPPRRPLTSPPFAAAVRCLFSLCRRRLFTSLSNGYFCTLLLSCWLPPPPPSTNAGAPARAGSARTGRHRQARVQRGVRRRGQVEAQDRAAGGGTHRRGRHRPRVHGRHRRRSQRRCRWAPAVAAAGRRRRQRGETSRGRLAGEMTATQEKNRQKRPRRQRKGRRRRRQRKERRTTRSEGGCFWGWCGHGRASQNHGRRGNNWPKRFI